MTAELAPGPTQIKGHRESPCSSGGWRLQNGHMTQLLLILGLTACAIALALVLHAVLRPETGLWPPRHPSRRSRLAVWTLTIGIVVLLAALSVLDWGAMPLPGWLRWGVGLPLVLAGNFVVWREAGAFGSAQTMGDAGSLRTEGFYRWSRNPQYVADMALVVGWVLVSASGAAVPMAVAVLALLALAPLAEEPWLEATYGQAWRDYRARVRRYL